MEVGEVIPHIGPVPIVIPLWLFIDVINFPADNVTARVAWKLRVREKVQQHAGGAGVAFLHVSIGINTEEKKIA